MDAGSPRRIVAAALLTIILGLFAVAITDWPHGIISAGFVAIALVVSNNL